MDSTDQLMFGLMLLFWIPSIVFILYKYVQIRKSEVVIGKVINIQPVFRSAFYAFLILYNGEIDRATINPNTAFQQFQMNDEIQLYRLDDHDYISYSVKGSNYTVAMVVSFIFFIASVST